MRVKFDEVMRESNSLVMAEHLAEETSARLAIENELVPILRLVMNTTLTCFPAVYWNSSLT